MIEYNMPVITINPERISHTPIEFIKERVEFRNYDERVCCEMEEFNNLQRKIAEMNGEKSYEYVSIIRDNPNAWIDLYRPVIGTAYIK